MSDYLEAAIDRVQHAINHEHDRRVVFLTGSGLSLPSVPGTADMTSILCEQMGVAGSRLKDRLAPGPEGYQEAARELKLRRGDAGLAAAIRLAVLRAWTGGSVSTLSPQEMAEQPHHWSVPPAQRALARVVARIPAQRSTPLFTTNFDPLTEVALREAGVPTVSLAAPSNVPIAIEGIFGALPIVHLHGYWVDSATLSTAAQLQSPRAGVEAMLRLQLRNSLVVVLGYGGWLDAFMRALTEMVTDGTFGALQCEIAWISHGVESELLADSSLGVLRNSAGVSVYWGVDATALLNGVADAIAQSAVTSETFPGWQTVPTERSLEPATAKELSAFIEGRQPSWAAAAAMPRLSATNGAAERLQQFAAASSDALVVLSGPTGEGKSLGLHQLAMMAAASYPTAQTLMRLPSVSRIDDDWVEHLKRTSPLTFVFVDEADLVLSDVVRLLSSFDYDGAPAGRVIWIVSLHSQYESRLVTARERKPGAVVICQYGRIGQEDANEIAGAWQRHELLPKSFLDESQESVAAVVLESATSGTNVSLFGAVLHLWSGDGLRDRVADLLQRLEAMSLRGWSYRDLLISIATVQIAWDPYQIYNKGLTLECLGRLCDLREVDVVPLIVAPLGREVGLSTIGDRVYVRHDALAQEVIETAREGADFEHLLKALGRIGGEMRLDKSAGSAAQLYHLWSRLENDEAIACARGTLFADQEFLEARVGFIAALRRNGRAELAERYASAAATRLAAFWDRAAAERGFWVEFGMVDLKLGHLDRSMAHLVKSLTDLHDHYISLDQLHYGLINSARTGLKIGSRRSASGTAVWAASMDLLRILPRGRDDGLHLEAHPVPTRGTVALVAEFRKATLPFSATAFGGGVWSFKRLLSAVNTHRVSAPQ